MYWPLEFVYEYLSLFKFELITPTLAFTIGVIPSDSYTVPEIAPPCSSVKSMSVVVSGTVTVTKEALLCSEVLL